MRVFLVIGILAAFAYIDLAAQTESAFTAVSVKPNPDPPNTSGTHQITAGRVHLVHVALKGLMLDAFRIKDYQLFSAASLTTGRWDVEATMPPDSSPEQVASMLRTMLKERFGLQTHSEKRTISVYVLTSMGRDKLQLARDPPGRLTLGGGASSPFRIRGQGNIAGLASLLSEHFDRPVLDKTGLEGRYQIDIEYSPPDGGHDDLLAPSLFTVLKDKLGLQLAPGKEGIDCVVVDKVALTATPN